MCGGLAPSAHALFGKHHTNAPKIQLRAKKNTSPYAYLAPKKQKKLKGEGWYRSAVTGQMVYGTKKK
jgi:hypothetical protein